MDPLIDAVRRRLQESAAAADDWLAVLDRVMERFEAEVGTIHRLGPDTAHLELIAQRGVPPSLMDVVTTIPVGKGMAGLAAQRREPVQVCNLQTDASGAVRPGAKLTQMEGSIAVPMLLGGAAVGTLGIGKPVAYTFSRQEVELLTQIANVMGEFATRGS